MSRGRHVAVDTDQILESLATLADDGETISEGGVVPKRLATECGYHRATVLRALESLVEESAAEVVWGFTDTGPKKSFLPCEPADGGAE
ncbi:helix-turn-helix domain-containing protein [Natrinema versiforme]|uniref:HTH iclR-type domain-containing protein n=1 Tax=Natrinema versiforme JCM 10478 TaxID=1227496 RepID=L9Y7E8_9EURY|nr:hypothetical protein [Natrinema versiforme]ELY68863.1 hypothetical protein C489_05838 [Natrinema versiforme JCM 10478]